MRTGEVRLVSEDTGQVSEDTDPGPRTGGTDGGGAVGFDSPAANLVPDDANDAPDVFVCHLR
ncbi:hypothetical protein [Streptomyces sp. H27-C3]|uniref:hypothetical protein n=1 Tax=Streptomyces sp. H27-C3 TaxID=3046305 RepID=UPI0024BB1F23|nr:hypothetical protein [Streptomyces sp. H27-C3]MDJ0464016.1 hypothetical protein [Streptomyces sp. H27-C3]